MQKAAGRPVQLVWRATASCKKEQSRIGGWFCDTCVTFRSQTFVLALKDDRHVSFLRGANHLLRVRRSGRARSLSDVAEVHRRISLRRWRSRILARFGLAPKRVGIEWSVVRDPSQSSDRITELPALRFCNLQCFCYLPSISMEGMEALVVEDEAKAATFLCNGLSENGWSVDVANDGKIAWGFLREKRYDIVLLDVLLPGIDGWSILRQMRANGIPTPVIFLTARDSLGERIRGLDLGADDYLVKPFAFSELMARIRTVLRRGRDTAPTSLRVSDLELDLIRHRVVRRDRPIDLTPKEFALLLLLARTPNEVVGRKVIAKEVWNMETASDSNVVDVAVRRLRRKVDYPFDKPLIHSVYGVGYVLGER